MNDRPSASTGVSPFFADLGQHPRSDFMPLAPSTEAPITVKELALEDAEDFADKMRKITDTLNEQLTLAQAEYEDFANRHRRPAPLYLPGDKVFLDARNLAVDRPSKKLSNKFEGPLKVLNRIGTHAYRLELLPTWKGVHDVFHTSML